MSGFPVETIEQRLVAIRRELHENPELSHEEFETTASIRSLADGSGHSDGGLRTQNRRSR